MFGVAALGAFGVSAWIATGGIESERTTNTTDDTAMKRYEDSIEVAKPVADPAKTPTPVPPPSTDSKQPDPYKVSYNDATYVLFGPSTILPEKENGFFMRAVDAQSMLELETVTFGLEEDFYASSGSANGTYRTDSAQMDEDGHIYFESSNEDVFHRGPEDTKWRISQALESGSTKTLVEVAGHPIDHWLISPEGDFIVYDVVGDHNDFDHEFYRYDIAKGTNTRIVMNTPYDQDYQPMDGVYRASFISIVGNELYGFYSKSDNVGYFYRTNVKTGVFTQTATHNWASNHTTFAPGASKTAWWGGDIGNVHTLYIASLDLTKGTSYTEEQVMTGYANSTTVEWNGAGSSFTFNRNNVSGVNQVYYYDVVTEAEKTTNLSGKSVGVYEWLTDMEFLYYRGEENKLGVYNVATGENRLFGFEEFTPYGVEYVTK